MRVLGFDVETTKLPSIHPWQPDAYLVAVGLADKYGWKKTWVFNHNELTGEQNQREMIDEIAAEIKKAGKLVGHNLKFDLNWLRHISVDFSHCQLYCTQVAEYLLMGQRIGQLKLGDLSRKYLKVNKIDRVQQFWDAGYETSEIPLHILLPYLEQDCINALAVYQHQAPLIMEQGMRALVSLQCETSRVLSDIEMTGMPFNRHMALGHINRLSQELEEIDREIWSLVGYEFNIGSGDELSAALYGGERKIEREVWYMKTLKTKPETIYNYRIEVEKKPTKGVGFKPLKNTELKKKGYYKTDKGTIQMLKAGSKPLKRVQHLLIERSKIAKALETMRGKDETKGLINKVTPDGAVHSQYNQTVAKTGRLSSKDPKPTIGVYKLGELLETPQGQSAAKLRSYLPIRRYMMIDAEFYYVTTGLSVERIAKLVGKRYSTVRDHLFSKYPHIKSRRQSVCYAKSKHYKTNPRWGKRPSNYKGLCPDGKGYLTVCKPAWYTGRKRYSRVFYHHVVMCKALGLTAIPRGFCVHHINADKTDNRLSNLALMTLSAHGQWHRSEGSETIPKGSRPRKRSKRPAQIAHYSGPAVI